MPHFERAIRNQINIFDSTLDVQLAPHAQSVYLAFEDNRVGVVTVSLHLILLSTTQPTSNQTGNSTLPRPPPRSLPLLRLYGDPTSHPGIPHPLLLGPPATVLRLVSPDV